MSRQGVAFDEWMEVIRGQNEGAVPKDYAHRVAKTVLRRCDPKQYLLSHATIVASVDTFAPKNATTGRGMNRGVQIDVRWPDFRIKHDCQDLINNNGDAWQRTLLLSTYRTFIGAQNYLEHIQIPELSKGFVVDAVARDLGRSCYIDILVATDKKHKQLVSDIMSGHMGALSMGCISLFTTCTKCGNVASDDSQLCTCVSYEGKHTEYDGGDGHTYKISELIGHASVPNSNQFIEASWVKNPAFRGAVRRNFLNADSIQVASQVESAYESNQSRSFSIPDGVIPRAASTRRRAQGQGLDLADLGKDPGQGSDDQGGQGGQGSDGQDPGGQSADQGQGGSAQDSGGQGGQGGGSGSRLDELLDKAQEQILTILVDRLGDRLKPKPDDVSTVVPPAVLESTSNSNLIRSSDDFSRRLRASFPHSPSLVTWAERAWRIVHVGGIGAVRTSSMTPKDLIVLSWIEDRVKGRDYPAGLYALAMNIGPVKNFPSVTSFLTACSVKAGRKLTAGEQKFLTWKGRIASISGAPSR